MSNAWILDKISPNSVKRYVNYLNKNDYDGVHWEWIQPTSNPDVFKMQRYRSTTFTYHVKSKTFTLSGGKRTMSGIETKLDKALCTALFYHKDGIFHHGKLTATLYTDASHIPGSEAIGYAGWIAGSIDGKKERFPYVGGKILPFVAEPYIAEMYAIVKGVNVIKQKFDHIDKILIRSDSTGAMNYLKGIKPVKSKLLKEVTELSKYFLTSTNDIKFVFKHVKAHTGGSDIPSKVNEWCDENSKRQRKYYERQLQLQKGSVR